jgi:hypothetical protein
MRASTLVALIGLAASAMLGPAFLIFHLPLVPNWPYVGAVCLAVSIVTGGSYMLLIRPRLSKPSPITKAWLLQAFLVWLAVFALFWSFVRLKTEQLPSLDFSDGVVVEKYSSPNCEVLSVKVQVTSRGILAVEGITSTSWNLISTGSRVSKRCGISDVTVHPP